MELEVKFLLSDPAALILRLEQSGAALISGRTHEYNLRFDTPERALSQSFRVLRLRKDAAVRVTYKGPGSLEQGVRARVEIEFVADDFHAARALFEALGYEPIFIYEKYRTTYRLPAGSTGEVEVVVDETPLGTFIEIEGEDAGDIRLAADHLGLDWDARIVESYLFLFETVKRSLALPFRDLTFAHFDGVVVTPEALGVKTGD